MSPLLWAFVAFVFVSLALLGVGRRGRSPVPRVGVPGRGDPDSLRLLSLLLPLGFGAAGLAAFGHPGVSILGALLFPPAAAAWLGWRKRRQAKEWEESAVAFLFGLLGLLRAGLSLPSALVRLGDRGGGHFSARLSRALSRFEEGKSLSDCLASAGRREPGPASLCLGILAAGYRQGVPVVPFLDRILPWLEEEGRLRQRAEEIRQSALAQAAVAGGLPWVVAWFASGPPGSWAAPAKAAAAGALLLQGIGFLGVRRWCTYE